MQRRAAAIAAIIAVNTFCATTSGAVLRVDADAAPGGDGLSWPTALDSLSLALDLAGPGDAVWVRTGTYHPDGGSGDRTATFLLDEGVTVIGGFLGGEADPADRTDPPAPTVLSGDLGAPGVRADDSYHVVTIDPGPGVVARLEDLTVERGAADGPGAALHDRGAGVLILGGAPVLRGVTVRECVADEGAGLYATNGEPTLDGCRFVANIADSGGGGASLRDGGLVLGCSFESNSGAIGGGLFICCGPTDVRDSVFVSNFGSNGGGLHLSVGSGAVARCVFHDNSATRGAGLYVAQFGAAVVSCAFSSNTASDGGGVYLDQNATVANAAFSRNIAFANGGAVYARGTQSIVNSTLWFNSATFNGGGVYAITGATTLANSILWANTDSSGVTQAAQVATAAATVVADRSCVEGWDGSLAGVGSFGAAPAFADPAGPDGLAGTPDDDFSLAPGSPCIDAGDGALLPPDDADVDDNGDTAETLPLDLPSAPRALDDPDTADAGSPAPGGTAVPDIGAVEFSPSCPGDLDGDGQVALSDFGIFASNFGLDGGATPQQGDLDGDGAVLLSDLSIFASLFGQDCAPAGGP